MTNKGRNLELIKNRNRKLVHRYYYAVLLGFKSAKTLQYLVEEFDLSESRINTILFQNSDYFNQIERECLRIEDLKAIYPFMTWERLPASLFRN